MAHSEQPLNPQHAKLPETWGGEMKVMLALGIPMALTQLAQFFVFTIDILMIGRLGPTDLAAAALGGVVYFFLWMVGSGPVMAVSPLVSQALGADQNDTTDARRSVRMSMWAIGLLFPFVVALVLVTEPLMLALGQDPVLAKKASVYILALVWGWPFALIIMGLRNFLAALGKTTIPFVLVMMTTAFNALFNYFLIFGTFGFPQLGLLGAGIASSLSYFVSFLLFVIYIRLDKDAHKFSIFSRFFKPDWERLRDVISLGWPISMTTIFEGMLFNAAVLLMGLLGVVQVAAYQIAINYAALAFMLPWGMSMAGAVRIGLARGADNIPAMKRATTTTMVASIGAISLAAIPILIVPGQFASLYLDANIGNNQDVINLVTVFLPMAAAFMLFDAVQVAANQLLRGLKDVKWPMVMTGISYWIIGFSVAAYLALKTPLEAFGVWYGLTTGLFAASVLLGARLWWLVWRR